jgi:KTSC domain
LDRQQPAAVVPCRVSPAPRSIPDKVLNGSFFFAILALISSWAIAEEVDVKYRGPLDLAPFQCTDVTRSSFIRRVCYDKRERYMLISLNGTYYHYCNIPESTVAALMNSDSMGRFFNAQVKGHFDCRLNPAPRY